MADHIMNNATPDYVMDTFPEDEQPDKLISDSLVFILELCFYVLGCGLFSIAGTIANTINAIVFFRQGLLSDSSNVSLFGLAVSDLFCLLTLLWMAVATSISMTNPQDWNWVPKDVMLLTGALPHVIFAQITCWITAYVSFERCMCVVFPFKMKTLFTAKRTAIIIPILFVYNFASYTPLFLVQSLRWEVNPLTNITTLVAHNSENYDEMQALDNYLNSFANRFTPLGVVLFCTTITSIKVKASKNWRKMATKTSDQDGGKSSKLQSGKEDTLVQMIVLISLIFLICYSSDIVMVFFKYLLPEIQHNNQYHNLFHVTLSLQFFLEAINSSLNIIVYFRLSTKYRREFNRLFSRGVDTDKTSTTVSS